MTQLLNPNRVGCPTFAFRAEFPLFSLSVNSCHRQIRRADIFPGSQWCTHTSCRRPFRGTCRSSCRCRKMTVTAEMFALTAETTTSISKSQHSQKSQSWWMNCYSAEVVPSMLASDADSIGRHEWPAWWQQFPEGSGWSNQHPQ
jgi:hypothetical protein